MKTIIQVITLLCILSYTHGQSLQELEDNKDWDLELLEFDIINLDEPKMGMMTMGAFPVKKYKGGAGVMFHNYNAGEVHIVGSSFLVGKHERNQDLYKDGDTHKTFFTILCLVSTDQSHIDDLINGLVLSRNHPKYLGQGYIRNQNFTVEHLSFIDTEDAGHAIVNLKLFDLEDGNVVLVYPQDDKSIRFKQLNAEYLSMDAATKYFNSLLEEEQVQQFFELEDQAITIVKKVASENKYQDKRIEVKFTKQMTQIDLDKIQNDMRQINFKLELKNVEFDKNGKLKSIMFIVETDDGFSGSATSKNLELNSVGFYRDYRKEATSSFGTGTL